MPLAVSPVLLGLPTLKRGARASLGETFKTWVAARAMLGMPPNLSVMAKGLVRPSRTVRKFSKRARRAFRMVFTRQASPREFSEPRNAGKGTLPTRKVAHNLDHCKVPNVAKPTHLAGEVRTLSAWPSSCF